MKQKNIVATLYLKDGHAVRSMTDFTMSMKRMSIRFETSIATLILKYAQEETLTVWKTSKNFCLRDAFR